MKNHGAALEIKQQVLGTTSQLLDALPRRDCWKLLRNSPAQTWLSDDDAIDRALRDGGCDATTSGFDFRQFGHEWRQELN
jgi:hypothetical protein